MNRYVKLLIPKNMRPEPVYVLHAIKNSFREKTFRASLTSRRAMPLLQALPARVSPTALLYARACCSTRSRLRRTRLVPWRTPTCPGVQAGGRFVSVLFEKRDTPGTPMGCIGCMGCTSGGMTGMEGVWACCIRTVRVLCFR